MRCHWGDGIRKPGGLSARTARMRSALLALARSANIVKPGFWTSSALR
jgi:hypothetical protein